VTQTDPTAPALRVLVVDADERTGESLSRLLCIGDRCAVVGTASHVAEALALVAEFRPDVLVVDLRLDGVDAGGKFMSRVRELAPDIRVLAMGADDAEGNATRVGADAFVRKTFRPRELVDAVLAAARVKAT
jgi:CheY-like chemotaxis protein